MNKKQKQPYRFRNWREYNAALVSHGSLTIWLDEAALGGWLHGERSGKRGASLTYGDATIQAALLLKAVYRLTLRGVQGFIQSVLKLMHLEWPVPHFSTLSRRQASVELSVPQSHTDGPLHLVVDSTGCKVYGEGEWKVRVHGASKSRTWRKLHLGVDEQTGEIVAAVLSSNNLSDSEALPQLLKQVEEPISRNPFRGTHFEEPISRNPFRGTHCSTERRWRL